MKSHTQNSFTLHRRTLCATGFALLIGAASAFAQSGASGSGSAGSSSSGSTGGANTGSYNSSSGSNRSQSGSYNANGSASSRSSDAMSSNSSSGSTSSSDKLSWSDRRFVTKAADDGQAEVQVAQLASQRATNPDVKNFAQKLVDDHTAVNSELMGIASSKNVKVDNDDNKDRTYKRLSNKSGNDFDREFIAHMVDEHEKDIKLFEKAANDAKDPEVRSFASKHVGHLREHLAQAQSLQRSIVPTGNDSSNSGSTRGSTSTMDNSNSSNSSTSGSNSSNNSNNSSNSSSTPNNSTSTTSR
jgi:putative membrane protein